MTQSWSTTFEANILPSVSKFVRLISFSRNLRREAIEWLASPCWHLNIRGEDELKLCQIMEWIVVFWHGTRRSIKLVHWLSILHRPERDHHVLLPLRFDRIIGDFPRLWRHTHSKLCIPSTQKQTCSSICDLILFSDSGLLLSTLAW